MVLSSDLISKFVKATKDEPKTKKETVVYGVVTKKGPPIYVKLFDENSDSDTSAVYKEEIPVTSTNVVVEVDDTVECTIKNHKLSITGTTNSPAARDGSTVNKSEIVAANAKIDNLDVANATIQDTLVAHNTKITNLEAANVNITDRLTADEADISNLKAADAEITGRLTAAEADIDYLQALDIDVEKLNAAYAFVDDLEASHADVDYLVSTVAEIDTLMFGSATGNVIQTSFSNAIIAQLGDAQVKSAMIESVSAGKITTGDIITNNVRVMSEDGSLIISDETLQISDSNRVRVQIGKDAANDYSINVWDQNGNLMFSKGGITDAAIKEAIIRNDMVSDTANIHASKLDIDSLFEEINDDGSNTIKSTKVYLDEKGQTLDVAFKSLTTEVTEQGETISSQGTQISTIQGQISSKIWQQDINTAKNEMSTQYSALEQEVDGFKTTVSETYATVSDLNNLEIGGRNLAVYKDFKSVYTNDTFSANANTGLITAENFKWYFNVTSVEKKFISGQTYTLSNEYIRDTLYDDYVRAALYNHSTSQTYKSWNLYSGGSITFTITDDVDTDNTSLYIYVATDTTATFEISKLKLEKGNKATDWTPAPEDVANDIFTVRDALDVRLATAEATIAQNADAILLKAEKTYVDNTLTNYSTTSTMNAAIELKANAITSEVNSTINNLQIGGRNLIVYKDLVTSYSSDDLSADISTGAITSTSLRYYFKIANMTGQLIPGQSYTLSNESIVSEYLGEYVDIRLYNLTTNTEYLATGLHSGSSKTFTVPDNIDVENTSLLIYPSYATASSFTINKLKLEKGNKATDWSPAPEDVDGAIMANKTLIEQTAADLTVKIESAAKTATNYLNFSSGGLVIGDLTASSLGKNVLIDSDSVDIRNGDTTLASFGADYLYLAKNSRNAKIDLCNGLATMYHESKYSYDTIFIIDTGNTTEIMGLINPLCITSVDDLDQVSIQFANANGVMGGVGIVGNWLRRFGSNMFDTYTLLDSGNYFDVMDSGWHYTGGYAENFTQYNNETHSQVRYRKVGGVVEVRGALKARTTIEGSDTKHTMFTLPEGYRPDCRIVQRCQGSGMHTWMLTVEESGAVTFSRYGVGSSYSDIGTSVWLPLQITFLVN